MNSIKQNIEQVINQIGLAAEKCGRDAETVQLLAVSKTKPIAAIEQAIAAGHTAFGENYVQEGVEKVQYFAQQETGPSLSWHFIGPIQSNKTRPIAEHFDWVHSVDRAKIARRLSEQRPAGMAPLNVLLQVNTSGEDSKSGLAFEQVAALADEVAAMPKLGIAWPDVYPAKSRRLRQPACCLLQPCRGHGQTQRQTPATRYPINGNEW